MPKDYFSNNLFGQLFNIFGLFRHLVPLKRKLILEWYDTELLESAKMKEEQRDERTAWFNNQTLNLGSIFDIMFAYLLIFNTSLRKNN